MKAIYEIMNEVNPEEVSVHGPGYPPKMPRAGQWTDELVEQVVQQYSVQLIDHILAHPEYIYVDDMEAVYSYEKFDELKKSIS